MNKLLLGMVSVATFCIAAISHTCPVFITNDTDSSVQIKTNDQVKSTETTHEDNSGEANSVTNKPKYLEFVLHPGEERRFGNHAHHVEFTVEKQDNSGKYVPVVSAKQLECAKRLVVVTVTSLMNHRYSDGTQIHPAKFEIIRLDKTADASSEKADDTE